ncbi:MAG: peptidylprolyl isomerase [Bacteroidota bacterium]
MSKLPLSYLILALFLALTSCQNDSSSSNYVLMETDLGNIYLRLYDETPQHRDNFLKLVNEGFYDGVAFHRVIDKFMVQAGDPRTNPESTYKGDDPGYKIPAEIMKGFVHTPGKLAAARMPDQINPTRESSGSQFFIVTGMPVNEELMAQVEEQLNFAERRKLYQQFSEENPEVQSSEKFEEFLSAKGYKDGQWYTQQQKSAYYKDGGAPHLDFQYTIFGEVVDGFSVVKKIEKVPVNPAQNHRPKQQVRIKRMQVISADQLLGS